jgi:RNA polymerase sigma-70 factor (ECF subfamily)
LNTYSSYSDEQLFELVKKDDVTAFTNLYDRHWKRLFALAANKVNNLYLAEDIVQEVFLDVWKRRADITINSTLGAYLSTAIKYKVLDARLKLARQTSREHTYCRSQPDHHSEVEQLADFHLLRRHLQQLLHNLPEKSQQIYQLSEEKGFSHREIARTLNISEKTVEYHLHKVFKSLRTGLGHLFSLVITTCSNFYCLMELI